MYFIHYYSGETFLLSIITNSHISHEMDMFPSIYSHPHVNAINSIRNPNGPYYLSVSNHLYRNSLFTRLHLPYRFSTHVQVDIYKMREITSINSIKINKNNITNVDTISTDAMFVPTQSNRLTPLDVFSTIQLVKIDSAFTSALYGISTSNKSIIDGTV